MKRKLIFIVEIIFCMAFLCACGTDNPEKIVKKYLECMKKDDSDGMQKYVYQDSSSNLSTTDDTDESLIYSALQSAINENILNMKYKIMDSTIEDEKAEVEVEITFVDMEPVVSSVIDEYISVMLLASFADAEVDDEGMEELIQSSFEEEMENTTLQTQTETITVECKKDSNSWKIIESDDLVNISTCNVAYALEKYLYELGDSDSESTDASDTPPTYTVNTKALDEYIDGLTAE